MKEQIQKLAEESGIMHTSMSDAEWIKQGRLVEKFAELIVGECLTIVERKEYSYHEADPLWETAQLIKEHFGVEQ